MDYLEAYSNRLKRNHESFIKLADELKSKGCKVYIPKGQLINFIKVLKGDKHIVLAFSEVPYRWCTSYNITPSKEQGSGRSLKTKHEDGTGLPFSADELISDMMLNPKQVETHYLAEV